MADLFRIASLLTLLILFCIPSGCGKGFEHRVREVNVLAHKIDAEMYALRGRVQQIASKAADILDDISRHDQGLYPNQRYLFHDGVVYHNPEDRGHGKFYYTGASKVGAEQQDKVRALEHIIPDLKELSDASKHCRYVVQSYVLTDDSLMVFYPYVDLLPYVPPRRDMRTRGIWQQAIAICRHGAEYAWGTPHIDTAGKGYMVSAVAPVTVQGRLAGVVGADVTLATLQKRFFNESAERLMLVDARTSQVLAVSDAASSLLHVEHAGEFNYIEQIDNSRTEKIVMPDALVLKDSPSKLLGSLWEGIQSGGDFSIEIDGNRHRVHSSFINEPQWFLVVVE